MKHLDLFSGIGGFALACQWNGIETIGFVEIDKYCQKVLRKHWPNVPIVEDIRDVEKIKEIVTNAEGNGQRPSRDTGSYSIQQADRQNLSKVSHRGILTSGATATTDKPPTILVTAGFPCQPFSVAGKRQGERDDRYLWPQTIAVIKAVKPDWILLENVTGIINLALDTVLSDLEGAGYSYETLIVPACAVNAPHRRDRVWIVANSEGTRARQDNGGVWQRASGISREQESTTTNSRLLRQAKSSQQTTGIEQCSEDVADSGINGLEGQESICKIQQSSSSIGCGGEDWWAVEPELGRVAHGIPNRVDRLKCLGNAIVPQVAYEIIKVISMTGERNG